MEVHTLSVEIPDYFDLNNITYFRVSIFHSTTKASWITNRRYSEFNSLFNSLSSQFTQIPSLPGKAFWKKFSSSFLEDRKNHLNEFITQIVARQELIQTIEVLEFLDIRQNIPGFNINFADEISHQKVRLIPFGIATIDLDYCFLALNPSNFDRIKLSLMEAEQSIIICQKTTGESIWEIKFPLRITCFGYSKQLTILGVGLENGGISAYRVKSELNYTEYEEFTYINPHSLSVIGLVLDYHTSELFTCSEDRKIKKINLQHEVELQECTLDSIPSIFFSDLSSHYLFVANPKTGLTVIDSQTLIPTLRISGSKMCKACTVSQGVLFIGYSEGTVNVYKESVLVTNLMVKGKIACIKYSSVRKEIVIGSDSGYISIWTRSGKMLKIWKGHEKAVLAIETTGNQVMTGGLDGNIVTWRLPVFWVDPEFEKIETIESEIQAKTMRVLKTQHQSRRHHITGNFYR